MWKYFWLTIVCAIVLFACRDNKNKTLVSATGTIYECLVVIDNHPLPTNYHYATKNFVSNSYTDSIQTIYDVIKTVLGGDMPSLPQIEPYFNVSHVRKENFDNFLKSSRNILYVDIDSTRYTNTKMSRRANLWSHPQAVYRIQTPNDTAFLHLWEKHGEYIRDWFVQQEIERQIHFYEHYADKSILSTITQSIGVHICVPNDFTLIMDTTLAKNINLVWCCNNKGSYRRDLVIYSYPYDNDSTFTKKFLCQKRDEVLKKIITTSIPGSHMGTEYKIFPPQIRPLHVQKSGFCMEMRGLWKIKNGEAMGGPFVSHTRIDEIHKKVITAEVFIFGAGQKKRNVLRQNEAILYSMKLEQELNELDEIAIRPASNDKK